jgi:molybdopterin-containing oxidoreductase family membrane subunit
MPKKPGIGIKITMITTVKQNIQKALDTIERSPVLFIWLSILGAYIFLAGYAYVAALLTSMEILEFSVNLPWETLIATYIFLVASGSGLCIVNALGSVFGMQRYEMMTKRMAFLSLTTILFGMLCIVLHLGHPERMPIYNAISPNFRSAISWMGLLYTIYMAVVVVEIWLLTRADLVRHAAHAGGLFKKVLELLALEKLRATRIGSLLEDPRLPRILGTLAFVSGASALSTLGSVFAHSESRVLWYGSYYPVYFLVSAIFSGIAFLLVVIIVSYRVKGEEITSGLKALIFEMSQVLAIVLAAGLVLITYRVASGLFDPASRGPVLLLLNGPFSPGFWIFEVGLMSVLPVFVLIRAASKKSLAGVLTGSLMVLIGTYVLCDAVSIRGGRPNLPEHSARGTVLLAHKYGSLSGRGCFCRLFIHIHTGGKVPVIKRSESSQ